MYTKWAPVSPTRSLSATPLLLLTPAAPAARSLSSRHRARLHLAHLLCHCRLSALLHMKHAPCLTPRSAAPRSLSLSASDHRSHSCAWPPQLTAATAHGRHSSSSSLPLAFLLRPPLPLAAALPAPAPAACLALSLGAGFFSSSCRADRRVGGWVWTSLKAAGNA